MKNHLFTVAAFVLGVVVGFSFVATGSEPYGVVVDEGPVYDGQKKLIDSFVKAVIAGDSEGCAKLYTDDTIYMQAELPMVSGARRGVGRLSRVFQKSHQH